MAATEQVNVRVPSAARELLLKMAQRLREDPQFADRLSGWLAEQGDPSAGPLLAERVECLERRLEALEARGAVRGATYTPRPAERTPPDAPPADPTLFGDAGSTPPAWTVGEGRGRRLTAEGEAELVRLIREGRSDSEVARAMNLKPNAVANRRKGLAAHPEEG